MANGEHLKILSQGVAAWNKWRAANCSIKPDLAGADLSSADLSDARLRGASLSESNLVDAKLKFADLAGADLSDTNLRSADLFGANLCGANLHRADLTRASISHADLRTASLRQADLLAVDASAARFTAANLCWANLAEADLSRADLSGARLVGAQLERATLTDAVLHGVNLHRAVLGGANITNCSLSDVIFGNSDLSTVHGLETVKHVGPSTIGIDTIYKSKGNIPEIFLRGAGVPENFITYMRSLTGPALDFYSCFICYSTRDQKFADRLYADLQANNVRCWRFDENAKWGEPLWGEIDTAIGHYDKLVVICSEHSLHSPPVIREIERALQKEDRDRRNVLFPVRIDDYLFDAWDHPRKADVVSKVVADFRGADNLASYTKALKRFLDALNR